MPVSCLKRLTKTGKVKNIPQWQISIILVFPFVSRFTGCNNWFQGTFPQILCTHRKIAGTAINLLDKGCNGTTNQRAANAMGCFGTHNVWRYYALLWWYSSRLW